MNTRRVVVTGMGVVSPLGLTLQETWANALEGKSGAGKVTLFDATECAARIACEVSPDFDPSQEVAPLYPLGKSKDRVVTQGVAKRDLKKFGRFVHLSMTASLEAYRDSGLDELREQIAPERIGTNIGVGMGGLPNLEKTYDDYMKSGFKRISPFFITQVITNMASGQLSIALNLKGPNMCNVTACSSSAHSIGESFRFIQRGDADIMLTGGAESVISPLGMGGFATMRALSTRNDEPEKASRPFDRDRDGFVMGEGAATLVLEEREAALKRGAKIYGEIVGYGISGDAYHMTAPAPEGEGGYRAMEAALREAGCEKTQIHYANAHGTSTPAGDTEEALAISRLFPEGKNHLHISSTKSMTGHMLGAAGAIEAVFSILACKEGRIPPTINLDNLDSKCAETGIHFVANRSLETPVEYALSNSFGFGGTNACLIFRKHPA